MQCNKNIAMHNKRKKMHAGARTGDHFDAGRRGDHCRGLGPRVSDGSVLRAQASHADRFLAQFLGLLVERHHLALHVIGLQGQHLAGIIGTH